MNTFNIGFFRRGAGVETTEKEPIINSSILTSYSTRRRLPLLSKMKLEIKKYVVCIFFWKIKVIFWCGNVKVEKERTRETAPLTYKTGITRIQ